MADRSMKALLLDEEASGPSDRPMRLVDADDAGAPPLGGGTGLRDAASTSARRSATSTLASPVPPRSSTPTRSTPAGDHALANPHGDPRLHHLAHAAQQDPARWGADLLLRGHNPRHY
jgi:hypothetical protein